MNYIFIHKVVVTPKSSISFILFIDVYWLLIVQEQDIVSNLCCLQKPSKIQVNVPEILLDSCGSLSNDPNLFHIPSPTQIP